MELELDELQKVNLKLDDDLTGLRDKLNSIYKLLHVYKSKYNNSLMVIKRLKTDIYEISACVQDYKDLKDGTKVSMILTIFQVQQHFIH